MSFEELKTGGAGTDLYVLGNDAVARGAIEAGVDVVSCYPGTPSSEIADTLAAWSKSMNFDFEYSVNEIVATEVAGTAALFGGKGMVVGKGAGFFVASDAVFHFAVEGIRGAFVLMFCDDPSAHSSGDEYDLRMLSYAGSIPTFVPSTPQEAMEMTVEAFKLSERIELPVMVRMSTRVCHQRGIITLGSLPQQVRTQVDWEMIKKDRLRCMPAGGAFVLPQLARKTVGLKKAEELSEETKFNEHINADSDVGILTCGVTQSYTLDAVRHLDLKASIYKIGVSFPLPEKGLSMFLKEIKKLFVVEELAPYLELHARAFAKEANPELQIFGKNDGIFPLSGEYNPSIVIKALSNKLGIGLPVNFEEIEAKANELKTITFPRPPVLCSGCPHRSSAYAIKKATKGEVAVMQDIGCHGLIALAPFELGNTLLCMGASVGTACGFNYISDRPVIATMGDSTFFHAGLPGLVNAVYNQADFTLIIMDNNATGMTGFQPNPGTGVRVSGRPGKRVVMEDVVKGIGVEDIKVVDSFNIKELQKAVKDSMSFKGVSVIISQGECAAINKNKGPLLKVDTDKCDGCWHCIDSFGCPSIEKDNDVALIVSESCDGCGVCMQICPFDAIIEEG